MTDKIEAIERLSRLLEEGKISSEEFELLKAECISSPRPSTAVNEAVPSSPPDWWRIAGIALVVLGMMASVATLITLGSVGELQGRTIIVGLLTHPLVWGGIVGIVVLRSRDRKPKRVDRTTDPTLTSRQLERFWWH
jgi:hypothetical protein